jgi:chromosome segregation ATPase
MIIDDLNVKLKKARSLIPDSDLLQKTLEAHETLKLQYREQETKLFDQNKTVK